MEVVRSTYILYNIYFNITCITIVLGKSSKISCLRIYEIRSGHFLYAGLLERRSEG